VALQIHSIVQNACDFDELVSSHTVQEKVSSPAAVPGDVERTEPRHNLVADLGAPHVWAFGKLSDRPNKCFPIEPGLTCSEILGGPPQDTNEIELRRSAEANTPFPLGHDASFGCAGGNLIGEVI
jgi:hypothetical protein